MSLFAVAGDTVFKTKSLSGSHMKMLSVSPVYFKQERRSQSRVKLQASVTGELDERAQWSTRLCFIKNKSL
jgi:hypothetical protein